MTKPAKFVAPAHARALAEETPFAVGGQQSYVYRDGFYQPGERYLGLQIVERLGDSWTNHKAEEIKAYLRITSPELWEKPPVDVINCANGLLDVKTRKLRDHSPEHLSPVRIDAAYDEKAKCPRIDKYLQSTIPELIALYEEIVGYAITPDNRYQRAFMFMGPGGTGKTTGLEVLAALLGPENVSTVELHKLEEDRFAVADLYGCLVNIFADLPSHALKGSSVFKTITGGDHVRGERKYRDAFTFKPYARLLFSANEVPPTADNSDAFFERWTIMPFVNKHRGTKHCDPNLLAKLTTPAELSGLLNRALAGLARVHEQHGFTSVAASEKAAERFRIDSDSAAGFVEERCEVVGDARTARTAKPDLFEMYCLWCKDNNRRPLASVRFNRRLRELYSGLEETSSKGRDYWIGIRLRGRR